MPRSGSPEKFVGWGGTQRPGRRKGREEKGDDLGESRNRDRRCRSSVITPTQAARSVSFGLQMQDHLPLVQSLPIYCHPSSCLLNSLNSLNSPHHHSSPSFGDSLISYASDFHLLWLSLLHSLLLSRVILLCILFWIEIELVRTVGRYCCCVVHNAQSLVPYPLSLSLSLRLSGRLVWALSRWSAL